MLYILTGITILMFIITVITLRKNSKLHAKLEEVTDDMVELLLAVAMNAVEVEIRKGEEKDE